MKTNSPAWEPIASVKAAETWIDALSGPGDATPGEFDVVEEYLRGRISAYDRRFDSSLVMGSIVIAVLIAIASIAVSAQIDIWTIGTPFYATALAFAAVLWLLVSGGRGSVRAERILFRLKLVRIGKLHRSRNISASTTAATAFRMATSGSSEDRPVLGTPTGSEPLVDAIEPQGQ